MPEGAARDEARTAPAVPEAEAPRAGEPLPSALTPRALALGSLIGALMCLSNLYLGLKTSLTFPAALIACVVGLGLQRALLRLSASRFGPPLSLRETSAMVSSVRAQPGLATGWLTGERARFPLSTRTASSAAIRRTLPIDSSE